MLRKKICQSTREVALNIGPGETLVGIEILDAKQVLGGGAAPSVALENVPLATIS